MSNIGGLKADYAVFAQNYTVWSEQRNYINQQRQHAIPKEDALSAAGIRLAASTATCVVLVMLLLFLMHKLRRHRLLLNIRHGLSGHNRRNDTSVMYSSACDDVDIGISYEPLHIAGAPPPYTPTCEEAPPAYSTIDQSSNQPVNHSSMLQAATSGNGIINSACQTTPPDSMHDIKSHAIENKLSPECANYIGGTVISTQLRCGNPVRTSGVGASCTDLKLAVDVDSVVSLQYPATVNPATEYSKPLANAASVSSLNLSESAADCVHLSPSRSIQTAGLPIRLEPIGGELPSSAHTVTSKVQCDRSQRMSRSAGSSPTFIRRPASSHKDRVTLTQYGFVDDGLANSLETASVIGLSEERLRDIAANKPDRLNARVRRQNRIKQFRSSYSSPQNTSFS